MEKKANIDKERKLYYLCFDGIWKSVVVVYRKKKVPFNRNPNISLWKTNKSKLEFPFRFNDNDDTRNGHSVCASSITLIAAFFKCQTDDTHSKKKGRKKKPNETSAMKCS